MRNPSGGEEIGSEVAVGDGVTEGVGNGSVLVGITEGVRLGSVVAVAVGAGVVTPQAVKWIIVRIVVDKINTRFDVFIDDSISKIVNKYNC